MILTQTLDAAWARRHPLPPVGDGGKEERGRVVVVGGGADLLGAVLLAGEASLRAGAGKLQVTAPPHAMAMTSLALPEAMVLPRPQVGATDIDDALAASLGDCHAVLVGPGMMTADDALAKAIASRVDGALVLDAAALSAAPSLARRSHLPVLTPHAGEMARLLDRPKAAVEADALAAAREAAERFAAVVVMKGAQTWVVEPAGSALHYVGGGPGLGVSGSGDVLAGLVAGLLARGASPVEAAAWGVLLHGEAGRRLADKLGPLGFLARDIAPEAPRLLVDLSAPNT